MWIFRYHVPFRLLTHFTWIVHIVKKSIITLSDSCFSEYFLNPNEYKSDKVYKKFTVGYYIFSKHSRKRMIRNVLWTGKPNCVNNERQLWYELCFTQCPCVGFEYTMNHQISKKHNTSACNTIIKMHVSQISNHAYMLNMHILYAEHRISNYTPCFRLPSFVTDGWKSLVDWEQRDGGRDGWARCFPQIRFLSIWSRRGFLFWITGWHHILFSHSGILSEIVLSHQDISKRTLVNLIRVQNRVCFHLPNG